METKRDKGREIRRARGIAKSLGHRVAAYYLKRRGWSVEAALVIIFG
jgi:hypothetical protein